MRDTRSVLTGNFHQHRAAIEQIRIERRPVIEEQFRGGRSRRRGTVSDHAEYILHDPSLQGHQALQQLTVMRWKSIRFRSRVKYRSYSKLLSLPLSPVLYSRCFKKRGSRVSNT